MSLRWNWWTRSAAPDPGARSGDCPHCATTLVICPSCRGRYDRTRLCQECMFGSICPACRRHWSRP